MRQGDKRKSTRPGARTWQAAIVSGLLLLAGCTTRVASYTPSPTAALAELPRPTRILVVPFVIDADAIQEDQGIGPRLQRGLSGDPGERRSRLAADVQSAISDTLVADLAKTGLPTQLASTDQQYRPGDLIVTGEVSRVDEGNRTRRLTIGFGAGKSTVDTVAQLTAAGADGSRVPLQRYNGSSDSGHRPGLALGAAGAVSQAGAVTGALAAVSGVTGEARRAPVAAEAERTAHGIAENIGRYLGQRGWTSVAVSSRE